MSSTPVIDRYQSVIDAVEQDTSGSSRARMERYANLRQDVAYALAQEYLTYLPDDKARRNAGVAVFERVWERAHAEGWHAIEHEYADEAEFQAKLCKIIDDYLESTKSPSSGK